MKAVDKFELELPRQYRPSFSRLVVDVLDLRHVVDSSGDHPCDR